MSLSDSVTITVASMLHAVKHKFRSALRRQRNDEEKRSKVYSQLGDSNVKEVEPRKASDYIRADVDLVT